MWGGVKSLSPPRKIIVVHMTKSKCEVSPVAFALSDTLQHNFDDMCSGADVTVKHIRDSDIGSAQNKPTQTM